MSTPGRNLLDEQADGQVWLGPHKTGMRLGLLHLVSVEEIQALRRALSNGELPPDLEAKLVKLAGGTLAERFIEQNCRLFATLFLAAQTGSFPGADAAAREKLLRVLAYVRKDDDAIPDYRSGGFADDQEEVRAATLELGCLLRAFKAWRLRHQVPALWNAGQVSPFVVPRRDWARNTG
jgi:hypothetical protein